ncbi:MAG: hypothetical protein HC906_10615, partial [Bacteroidales bacterium]|nr:hypothetical protein [Bacteroidales bacterium]
MKRIKVNHMKAKIGTAILFILSILATSCNTMKTENGINVTISTDSVLYTMQGGIGASWHAIRDVYPLKNEKYKYPIREVAALGSAHDGNPPVSYEKQWDQIYQYASWLGLDFM